MRRPRLPTLLETVFAAAVVLMAWHAVVPTLRRARDEARVDVAARTLATCSRAVRHMVRDGELPDASEATLDAIAARLAEEAAEDAADGAEAVPPRLVWPDGADLSTFASAADGCSLRVTLGDGTSVLVTPASNRVDHAN